MLQCSLFFWKGKGFSIFLGPSHQDRGSLQREEEREKVKGMYTLTLFSARSHNTLEIHIHGTDTITTHVSAVMQ